VEEAKKNMAKTSTGIDENIAGALCYVGWWVTGLIFFLIEKDNKFVRFHAMQSILVFFAFFILGLIINFVGIFIWFLWWFSWIIWLLAFIAWLILMIKAYQGEKFKLPIVGDIAEKNA
jgi:uncharacterized membrane protein